VSRLTPRRARNFLSQRHSPVLAEKKPYFRACGGGRPAVRQFPDPRAQPILNLWKEHKRCSGEKGRHQDSEKKGTSAKSRLLRIATRGWIDRLGLVSWLLRLALRQLLHRPSPHISALQSIQEQVGDYLNFAQPVSRPGKHGLRRPSRSPWTSREMLGYRWKCY
jgi:hypothetical protein